MSYDVKNDDMSYWAHGLCAHQVSFEIASKEEWNLTNLYYYYYYYCAYNNNSEDETTQKQDPIPLLGEWDN